MCSASRFAVASLLVVFAARCGPARTGFVDSGPDGNSAGDVAGDAATQDGSDATIDVAADTSDDTSVMDTGSSTDDTAPVDTGPVDSTSTPLVYVYGNTSSDLYRVHPVTFAVLHIGTFGFPADGNDHEMTDIGVTATGDIWGVTFNALYRVDSVSAGCTLVAPLGGGVMFNGLTFLPSTGGAPEQLVGADTSGNYYSINTTTGATTRIGSYGGGHGSSGDIVSVAGAGTFATITSGPFVMDEYLAQVNSTTGAATVIGSTGLYGTWGLGYWGGVVYGFTMDGRIVTIDVTTGHATTVSSGGPSWWGAGVTTHAPLTHL